MSDKTLQLTPPERDYLLKILKEHQNYYWILGGNPKCSERNKAAKDLVDALCLKLK